MLPEVGASELIVIAIVALIVVGPKDLPILLRRFGQFMARLRGMANEFRASFDEMARQSELDELRKEVEAMRRGQFGDATDFNHEMRSTVSEIESNMSDVGVDLHPPSYQYDASEPPPPPPLEISEAPPPAAKPARKPAAGKPAAAKANGAAKPVTRKTPAKAKAAAEAAPAPKARKRAAKSVEGGA